MITCLHTQFKASGHCVVHRTVSEVSIPLDSCEDKRSRFEFLPEFWQNNPSKKQHKYSLERACFPEPFLKSLGSGITSCQSLTRDLRPGHRRPVISLRKTGLSSLGDEAQMSSKLGFLLLSGKVRNQRKPSKYGL